MLSIPSHDDLARGLLAPVLAAGALQLDLRRAGVVREQKPDASAVTEADRKSEVLLAAALTMLAPGLPIIAEEAVAAGHVPECAGTLFLIDPLDGTEEYIRGGDDFTVNVGLVVDGTPTFGIVYAPARKWLCVTHRADAAAEAEVGADVGPASSDFDALSWRPMRVRPRPASGPVAVASRSHPNAEEDAWLRDIGVTERVAVGSSLKFCLVARGDADVYPRFNRISEWDTAAGHAILLAAGGRVDTRDGRPWRYGDRAGGFRTQPFVAWGGPVR
jgi:3'(2'), 5'-bisphosphate nucleotidase